MAINALYVKYFQKSKIFIYPLLDIKRGSSVVPVETYVSWDNHYTPEDMKLICLYDIRTDDEYKTIVEQYSEAEAQLIRCRYHYNNLDKYVSLKQSELKRDLALNGKQPI